MEKLLLYGFGERCRILLNNLKGSGYDVVGIIDTDPLKWGTKHEGYCVYSPEFIKDNNESLICVTFFSPLEYEPIWETIQNKYGVERDRICSFHELLIRIFMKKKFYGMEHFCVNSNDVRNYAFDSSWKMGLGGVELWLEDIKKEFEKDNEIKINWIQYTDQKFEEKSSHCFDEEIVEAGIKEILKILPCTIVFSRVDEMMLSAFLIKKAFPDRIKIVMSVHGACDGMYKDILSYRDEIYYYICVSNQIKNELKKNGIDEDRISIMTIPVPYIEGYSHIYTDSLPCPLRIGYAGRLEVFHKRADLLLKLILELEKRNVSYDFSIVGEGSFSPELENLIEANHLEKKIHLLGLLDRKDIPRFWIDRDIAINVSDSEGRPLSNMEAMAAGAVPIVTSTPGSLEDVKDGINGYLVAKGDYIDMASRIQFLSEHREQLKKMGQQAQKDMMQKISMEKHLDLWKNILRTI